MIRQFWLATCQKTDEKRFYHIFKGDCIIFIIYIEEYRYYNSNRNSL